MAIFRHMAGLAGIKFDPRGNAVVIAGVRHVGDPARRMDARVNPLAIIFGTRDAVGPVTILAEVITVTRFAVLHLVAYTEAVGANPGEVMGLRSKYPILMAAGADFTV